METNQVLITEENARRRYNNSHSQELYEFMKGKSGERALGLYVLKGTRTALRGKRGSNPSTYSLDLNPIEKMWSKQI